MKLIACSFLILVILEESYCKTTTSVNKTSTSWGYGYSLSDTRGFEVKHDHKGYQFDPFYNNTSSDLKKHYNSFSVYDQFTSPGATNDSPSHSSTSDVINGTSNGTTNFRSNNSGKGDKVPNKVLFDTPAGKDITTVPVTKTHTGTVTKTRTEADNTRYKTPVSSYSLPVHDMNGSPIIPSNGQLHKTTSPYGSQNTPMYAAPTGPLYYPQAPSYGQVYGPAGGPMYAVSSSQMYRPQMGPMYGPPTDGTYGSTGPIYGYAPQNGQMYGPPNGQMYVPQNRQINGYPTGSLYGSHRN